MIYIWLNISAILAATLVAMAIGAVWRATLDPAPPARVPATTLAIVALGLFWLAAILAGALILAPDKAPPWVMAIGSAVVIWAGFVLPVVAVTQRYRAVRAKVVLADSLVWLAMMVAMAVTMKLIGLVPPPG